MILNKTPGILGDREAVNIFENLHLVPASVDEEPVEVPHEGVVSPRFGQQLGGRPYFEPLLLLHLELEQVVEVRATLASVAAEVEDAVAERDPTGA